MDVLLLLFQRHGIPMTWEGLILLLCALGAILYGWAVGRDRSVILLLAMYLSLAVVTNVPALGMLSRWLPIQHHPTLRLVWFLGLFFLLFFLLWRSPLLSGLSQERGAWWESAMFALLQVGLAVSTGLFLLPPEVTGRLHPMLSLVFLGTAGRSFWLLAPLIAFVWIGREGEVFEDE